MSKWLRSWLQIWYHDGIHPISGTVGLQSVSRVVSINSPDNFSTLNFITFLSFRNAFTTFTYDWWPSLRYNRVSPIWIISEVIFLANWGSWEIWVRLKSSLGMAVTAEQWQWCLTVLTRRETICIHKAERVKPSLMGIWGKFEVGWMIVQLYLWPPQKNVNFRRTAVIPVPLSSFNWSASSVTLRVLIGGSGK